MSYQSEDRYWTDYLRVALPVIGLLLMLALFWWWAQQFIGDDGDADDLARATQTIIATAPALTPTNTVPVVIDSTPGEDLTETPEGGQNGTNGEGDETPSDGETQNCGFLKGNLVSVTAPDVRLRDDPVVDVDNIIVESISEDAQLRIVDDCYIEDDEGNQFWLVRDEANSQTGYVAGDFLALVDDEE